MSKSGVDAACAAAPVHPPRARCAFAPSPSSEGPPARGAAPGLVLGQRVREEPSRGQLRARDPFFSGAFPHGPGPVHTAGVATPRLHSPAPPAINPSEMQGPVATAKGTVPSPAGSLCLLNIPLTSLFPLV